MKSIVLGLVWLAGSTVAIAIAWQGANFVDSQIIEPLPATQIGTGCDSGDSACASSSFGAISAEEVAAVLSNRDFVRPEASEITDNEVEAIVSVQTSADDAPPSDQLNQDSSSVAIQSPVTQPTAVSQPRSSQPPATQPTTTTIALTTTQPSSTTTPVTNTEAPPPSATTTTTSPASVNTTTTKKPTTATTKKPTTTTKPNSTTTKKPTTTTTKKPTTTTTTKPTTTTAAPTTTTTTTTPATTTKTFNLVGGSTAVSFSSGGVTVLWANAKPGFIVTVVNEPPGKKVEFRSDDHRSRVDVWWNNGPQWLIQEKPDSSGKGKD